MWLGPQVGQPANPTAHRHQPSCHYLKYPFRAASRVHHLFQTSACLPNRPPACRLSRLPAGTRAAVCSLHHFIHWRHPAVLVEEMAPWEAQPTVYQASKWCRPAA